MGSSTPSCVGQEEQEANRSWRRYVVDRQGPVLNEPRAGPGSPGPALGVMLVDQLFCASHVRVAESAEPCRSSNRAWGVAKDPARVGAPVSPMSGSQ